MALNAGIDEVHKCPVLGSIYLCIAIVPDCNNDYLKEIGVKDSKLIGRSKLHTLAKELSVYEHKVLKISAEEISKAENLNLLEVMYIIKLIKWANKFKPNFIYLDCLTANVQTCYNYFYQLGFKQKNLRIISKADEKILSVQAASIIAKYYSDKEMERLKERFPDMGSGEPHDMQTRRFIYSAIKENNGEKLKIIRKNWETYKREYRRCLACLTGSKKKN